DRRHIGDRDDLQPIRLERAYGGLTASSRPLDEHFDLAHAVLQGLARRRVGSRLCSIWRTLARAFEPILAGARPAHHIARRISDRHDCVIECALNMRLAARYVFLLTALAALP